jgi:hypothetical protein
MAKMRSPNYPSVGLRDALLRVRGLWGKEKRTPVDYAVAAEAIGYGGLNGPSRSMLSSMKKYGLIESDDRTVRVSDLALRILHPANDQEALEAVREAALKPELFGDLYHTHRDASDAALRSHLITKLGFSEVGARQVIKAFRDTLSISSLDEPSVCPPEMKKVASDAQQWTPDSVDYKLGTSEVQARPSASPLEPRRITSSDTPQTFSWPLAPGVRGEVKIVGDEPKPQYLKAIKNYLELAMELLAAGVGNDARSKQLKDKEPVESGIEGGTGNPG